MAGLKGKVYAIEKSTCAPPPVATLFPTGSEDKASPNFTAVTSLEYRKLHLLPVGHIAGGGCQPTREGMIKGIIRQPPPVSPTRTCWTGQLLQLFPIPLLIQTDTKDLLLWGYAQQLYFFTWTVSPMSALPLWSYLCPMVDVFHTHLHSHLKGLSTTLKSVHPSEPEKWPFSCKYLKKPKSCNKNHSQSTQV